MSTPTRELTDLELSKVYDKLDTTPCSTLKVMRGQDDEENPIAYMRNEGEPNNLVKCTFACPGAFGVYAKRAL